MKYNIIYNGGIKEWQKIIDSFLSYDIVRKVCKYQMSNQKP